ncbi:hypothetical protein DFQ28_006341 [Apophysomyces sp. BC1034]|nr:hypothetical protein DFQ30_009130 [Apophysomyces sp. BC1015]KAG0181263.1 hypothetical protein DFQ29_008872 [Apophysomyces sp. BC1021]KAG0193118.1 hypothetical protein DFQ28_006341 [Apophysomyces sp. BC1034]
MLNAASKAKGNISSVFSHLGASKPILDPRFAELKRTIVPKDPSVLQRSFDRLLNEFEKENAIIRQRGSAVIPEVSFDEIRSNGGRFPSRIAKEIEKRGAVVVRNVVDRSEAADYKERIQEYIDKHPGIVGFPTDKPQVWELYWTPSQIAARSHPHFTSTAVALNHMWHTSSTTPIDLSKNLVYCDRLRIRQSGDSNFALAGHVDGGSIERWEDPEYRNCYAKILEGNWEQHDPFDVTHRIGAEMDMYNSPGGCSMFRSFQGWLAISKIQQGGGTLRVSPLIKEPTAYFMLKPLLEEHLQKSDFMGAWPGRCQDITSEDHAPIVDSMVSMPAVDCGDAVFWHCDQVHAVEPKNEMATDSSVLYIPATPLCKRNSEYLKKQKASFTKGLTPNDFPQNHCEQDFLDKASPATLNQREKLGMGFSPYSIEEGLTEGQRQALEEYNSILAPFSN